MARQLFGTDGVRGRANFEPMTADTTLRLGMAAGARFVRDDHRHQVVIEGDIERLMAADLGGRRAESRALGRAWRIEDASGRYIEAVKASLARGLTLDGMTVAIDSANGAAYKVAPRVLAELGAKVIALGVDPDGSTSIKNAAQCIRTSWLRRCAGVEPTSASRSTVMPTA